MTGRFTASAGRADDHALDRRVHERQRVAPIREDVELAVEKARLWKPLA
jgi:hypothetical protein